MSTSDKKMERNLIFFISLIIFLAIAFTVLLVLIFSWLPKKKDWSEKKYRNWMIGLSISAGIIFILICILAGSGMFFIPFLN